jgi:hypothetical protein
MPIVSAVWATYWWHEANSHPSINAVLSAHRPFSSTHAPPAWQVSAGRWTRHPPLRLVANRSGSPICRYGSGQVPRHGQKTNKLYTLFSSASSFSSVMQSQLGGSCLADSCFHQGCPPFFSLVQPPPSRKKFNSRPLCSLPPSLEKEGGRRTRRANGGQRRCPSQTRNVESSTRVPLLVMHMLLDHLCRWCPGSRL